MKQKSALLVVDVQEAFSTLDECRHSIQKSIPVIIKAIEIFRASNSPVVFTRTSEAKKLNIQNGYEVVSSLAPRTSDLIINKDYPNSFWQTDLEQTLKSLNVNEVVICGCFSMACVFQTYNGALERGFSSYILDGATVTSHEETNDWLRRLANIKRIDELILNTDSLLNDLT